MEKVAVHRFASISNPDTYVFMDKMEDMIQIYNHTEQICFDDKKIYLIASYKQPNPKQAILGDKMLKDD